MQKSTPFIAVYSFAAILAIFGAVGYFLYNMQTELSIADSRSNKTFATFVSRLQRSKVDNVAYLVGNFNDYSSIYVTKNNSPIYSYPNTLAKDAQSSKFIKVYRTTFQKQDNGASYVVTAALYTLRPATIFRYAKTSFIVVAIVTVLTAVVLICQRASFDDEDTEEGEIDSGAPVMDVVNFRQVPLSNPSARLRKAQGPAVKDFERAGSESRLSTNGGKIFSDNGNNPKGGRANLESPANNFDKEAPDDNNNFTPSADTYGSNEKVFETSSTKGDEPSPYSKESDKEKEGRPSREAIDHISDNEEKESVLKMYSEDTGVLLESQLERRLGSILSKCAAGDEELCLFMVQTDALQDSHLFSINAAKLLIEEAMFRDRVFECKTDGEKTRFAFIKEGMAINSAVDYCRALIKKLKKLPAALPTTKVLVGASSRAGRLVESSTLITEVKECLHRAESDNKTESKIVSFLVDLGKYRETLMSEEE